MVHSTGRQSVNLSSRSKKRIKKKKEKRRKRVDHPTRRVIRPGDKILFRADSVWLSVVAANVRASPVNVLIITLVQLSDDECHGGTLKEKELAIHTITGRGGEK
jgi:signal peptidase I